MTTPSTPSKADHDLHVLLILKTDADLKGSKAKATLRAYVEGEVGLRKRLTIAKP